jgi:sporulation related protein
MTKWIVGLLLLANLALFGWMRWGNLLTVNTDAGTTQAELHPEMIKLLENVPASSVAAASATTSGLTLTLSPVSAPVVSAPAITHVPAPVHLPASAPMPVSAPAVAATAPSKASNCAEWGEFSGDDLSRAQQALSMMKLGDNLTQRSVEHNHGYWVYIPPLRKRANVEKKIAQLKERGIKDYFVVQEKGKWLNAISLGIFRTQDAAEKYMEMLRSKDVSTAKLGDRVSKLKYTVFVISDLDSGTTDKLNALQKEFPESELKLSACNN